MNRVDGNGFAAHLNRLTAAALCLSGVLVLDCATPKEVSELDDGGLDHPADASRTASGGSSAGDGGPLDHGTTSSSSGGGGSGGMATGEARGGTGGSGDSSSGGM